MCWHVKDHEDDSGNGDDQFTSSNKGIDSLLERSHEQYGLQPISHLRAVTRRTAKVKIKNTRSIGVCFYQENVE